MVDASKRKVQITEYNNKEGVFTVLAWSDKVVDHISSISVDRLGQ